MALEPDFNAQEAKSTQKKKKKIAKQKKEIKQAKPNKSKTAKRLSRRMNVIECIQMGRYWFNIWPHV